MTNGLFLLPKGSGVGVEVGQVVVVAVGVPVGVFAWVSWHDNSKKDINANISNDIQAYLAIPLEGGCMQSP